MQNPTGIDITTVGENPTVAYAGAELERYLRRALNAPVRPAPDRRGRRHGIRVGLASDLGVECPATDDPRFDDAISIDISDEDGFIAGSNPRSVLLAVYRYLTELGFRWIRPGDDGLIVPSLESARPVKLTERASYRHRGVCIEGSPSFEHVRDMIDWLPKLGFNAYFIQFRECRDFLNRWYAHGSNPLIPGTPLSADQARDYMDRLVAEIKKRDILYHAVGHGWTSEALGLGRYVPDRPEGGMPDEVRTCLAQVGGRRGIWLDNPTETSLCYSNPDARRILVDEVVRYAEAHPEVDVLHFWLADGANNNCECPGCAGTRPSDYYVRMLNDIASALYRKRLPTRVVFLVYSDLLWPPEHERIEQPDRFILMFAPSTRTYSSSFRAQADLPQLPPFRRNRLDYPRSIEQNLAFLAAWQELFEGDSFDFDYHMMFDHYNDLGYRDVARVISQDVKELSAIGLHGLISCQVQRCSLPTGLPMTVMGRTLWDVGTDLEGATEDYFSHAFGSDWQPCRDYLTALSELLDPPYQRGERPRVNPVSAAKFGRVHDLVSGFLPIIERNLDHPDPSVARSWFYLKHHAEITSLFAEALRARVSGNDLLAEATWAEVRRTVLEKEAVLHPVLDAAEFISPVAGKVLR